MEQHRSLRACQALQVVIQHWMVPDLGWYLGLYEHRLKVFHSSSSPSTTNDNVDSSNVASCPLNSTEDVAKRRDLLIDLESKSLTDFLSSVERVNQQVRYGFDDPHM